MTRVGQGVLMVVLSAAALLAAWRVVVVTQADRWAVQAPERALDWVPNHPLALLTLAERQLKEGKRNQAVATARYLLSVEPLEGRGFRVLAQAAQQADDPRALQRYRIAAHRAPRDLAAHGWLSQHYLTVGDYRAALEQIDLILRISPTHHAALLPMLAQLAADPAFAAELGRSLRGRPVWRDGMLAALQARNDPAATDRVLSALQREGGLSDVEFDRWIEHLIATGRWGEAYSRWAGAPGRKGRLTPVYNGGFDTPPTSRGFDWRVSHVAGVGLEFVPDAGARGLVAYARFRNRPVAQVGLEQPLLLAPGHHRLSARMRGEALRSDRGLEWVVVCAADGTPVAVSERINGTFGWRGVVVEVVVPATGCEGQWLRLRNPAPSGSGQGVSGDLWFDEVAITPVSIRPTSAVQADRLN